MTRSKQFAAKAKPNQLVFEATGTHWRIDFADAKAAQAGRTIARDIIAEFEQCYSRFLAGSSVDTLSKRGGQAPIKWPALLELYKQLSTATNGAVTPAVGAQLVAAGYDQDYSLQANEIPNIPNWLDVISWDSATITAKQPIQLDFGAAGKGFLIDLLASQLSNWLAIDGGGDIATNQPRTIGLEDPNNPAMVVGSVKLLPGQAIAASSHNRRTWAGHHHIMDTTKRRSANTSIIATWAIADSAAVADAMATALYLAAPNQLNGFDFDYAILDTNYTLIRSKGFAHEPAHKNY